MKRSRKRSIVERGKRQDLNRNPPLLLVCPFIHCYAGQYLAGELICILEQDPLTLQLIAEELEEAGFAPFACQRLPARWWSSRRTVRTFSSWIPAWKRRKSAGRCLNR